MDAASLLANEQFAQLERMRDQAIAKLNANCAALRAQVDMSTQTGLCFIGEAAVLRRRAAADAHRKIDNLQDQAIARIRDAFAGLAKDYKPHLGTFNAVQEEAAEGLSYIFD